MNPSLRRNGGKLLTSLTAAGLLIGGPAGLLVLPRPAAAQNAPAPVEQVGGPAAQPASPPIDTLARALDLVAWNAQTAGPLFALDVQNVRPWKPRPGPEAPPDERWKPAPPLAPPANGGNLRLQTVAPFFGRKVIRVGTLTVLAPTEMVTLNRRPGIGDPFGSMRREEKAMFFAASLSDDQWRQIASPNGLGAGDLTTEQRALFLSLLPAPFRLQKMTVGPNGQTSEDQNMTLPPARAAQVRLRISRSVQVLFPAVNQPNTAYLLNRSTVNGRAEGDEYYALNSTGDWALRPDAYGVLLRQEGPNRFKPGQLDFTVPALQTVVSLEAGTESGKSANGEGAPAGALTVDALLKRIGEATGLELIADNRAGRLSVWTRGRRARAGDVLQALCWAVTGTFRQVGPAYVLTDDVDGIGARRAILSDWARNVQAGESKTRETLQKRIRDKKPGKLISFAPGDPLALDDETYQKLRTRQDKASRPDAPWNERNIPVAELPPVVSQFISSELAKSEHEYVRTNSHTDRVRFDLQSRLTYLVPGIGDVDDPGFSLYNVPLFDDPPPAPPSDPNAARKKPAGPPPVALGPTMAARILYVAPKSANEAQQAVLAARRHGLSHVWVRVPDGDNEAGDKRAADLLQAAAEAGRAQSLAVFGVVDLLRRPIAAAAAAAAQPDSEPTRAASDNAAGAGAAAPSSSSALAGGALDVNIRGETGAAFVRRRLASPEAQQSPWLRDQLARAGANWLRPQAPEVAQSVKRRLVALAATPGLAGLVLTGTAAPGYDDPGQPAGERSGWSPGDENEYGYSVEQRLVFLRKEGYDPIDLVGPTNYVNADLDLPFFSDQAFQPRHIQLEGGRWGPEPNWRGPREKWRGLRYEQNAGFLADLYAALKAARPDLVLVLRSRPDTGGEGGGGYESWYGTWDKPNALPRSPAPAWGQPNRVPLAQTARTFSQQVFLSAAYSRPTDAAISPREAYASLLGYLLDQNKTANWNGIVFDLSNEPLGNALPALDALNPSPPPAQAAAAR